MGETRAAYQAAGLLPTCSTGTVMTKKYSDNYVKTLLKNHQRFTNPPCLPSRTHPTYNVYTSALLPYVNVYSYSYGDFLGIDNIITYSYDKLLPRAQPATITLR